MKEKFRKFRLDLPEKPVDTILLKIFVPEKQRSQISFRGLEFKAQESSEQKDFQRQQSAAVVGSPKADRLKVGRVRQGRIDTGCNWLKNQPNVGGPMFLGQLCQDGWYICGGDSHWFNKSHNGTDQKVFVLVLKKLRRGEQAANIVSKETIADVSEIIKDYSFTAHGWLNPHGKPATLNLVVPVKGGPQKFSVSIENGRIGLVEN